MTMVRVAEFSAGMDANAVRRALDEHRIPHRIEEEGGALVLYLRDDANVEEVVALLRRTLRVGTGDGATGLAEQWRRTPAVLVCLALSLLGALLVWRNFDVIHWFTFVDFRPGVRGSVEFGTLAEAFAGGEYWRLVTPIFIHFGPFHIVFNGLWLWEFGRRVETLAGSRHFLMLVAVIGISSNLAEHLWGRPSIFGGMSGVVFGLLGYIWMRNKLAPHPTLMLPPGLFWVMLAYLVVCMTGIIQYFFNIGIANAAHGAGLLMGLVLGALFGLANRGSRPGDSADDDTER